MKPIATQFNLSFDAFGVDQSHENGPAYGTLTLSDAFGKGLEPAPITSTDEHPYQLLSGTIKAVYNTHRSLRDDSIIVAPGIMSGNSGEFDNINGL